MQNPANQPVNQVVTLNAKQEPITHSPYEEVVIIPTSYSRSEVRLVRMPDGHDYIVFCPAYISTSYGFAGGGVAIVHAEGCKECSSSRSDAHK